MSLPVKLPDLAIDRGDAFWDLRSLIRTLQFSVGEMRSLQRWTLLSDHQRETRSCKNRNRKYLYVSICVCAMVFFTRVYVWSNIGVQQRPPVTRAREGNMLTAAVG